MSITIIEDIDSKKLSDAVNHHLLRHGENDDIELQYQMALNENELIYSVMIINKGLK